MAKFKSTMPLTLYSPPWKIPIPEIDTSLKLYPKERTANSVIQKKFSEVISRYNNYKLIYTDASKSEIGVGAAIVSMNYNQLIKLPDHSSIYTGEITAIREALRYANELEDQQIMIVSDSLSALESLKRLYPVNEILKQIKKQLNHLNNLGKTIKFLWVPSHCGIEGNEEADDAAVKAITDDTVLTITQTPHCDLKPLFKHYVLDQWQRLWNSDSNKMYEIQPDIRTRMELPKKRRDQVVMSRLRIGHSNLTHVHLFTRSVAPSCPTCNTVLTIKHIVIECPTYSNYRRIHHIPLDLRHALTKDFVNIISFLKHIGLYYRI